MGPGPHPAGAVGDGLAAEQQRAAVAQRPEALQTRRALATCRDEGKDDVITLGDVGDSLADLGDDTGAFVAAECGQPDRGGSGRQVIVGVAHAGGMQLNLDFVGDGIAQLDLIDAEPRIELPEKRAFGLHPSDLSQPLRTRYKAGRYIGLELR